MYYPRRSTTSKALSGYYIKYVGGRRRLEAGWGAGWQGSRQPGPEILLEVHPPEPRLSCQAQPHPRQPFEKWLEDFDLAHFRTSPPASTDHTLSPDGFRHPVGCARRLFRKFEKLNLDEDTSNQTRKCLWFTEECAALPLRQIHSAATTNYFKIHL